jgi:hypothetical protein
MTTLLRSLLFLCLASASHAQSLPGFTVDTSTQPISSMTALGYPIENSRGPWVIGDVKFEGVKDMSIYTLQNAVRARRGLLYTPSDKASDVSALDAIPGLRSVQFELYGMPGKATPDNYAAIAVSTEMVRVVFRVEEQQLFLPGLTRKTTNQQTTTGFAPGVVPAAQSAVVMTPTAYRGINQYNRPGLGMDINAVYFIGRLYGKNNLSSDTKNFIDRIGIWFLSADGKMQLQSESQWRPALSVGARGFLTFRDAAQPSVNAPGVSVQVDNDNTRALSDGYVVMTKDVYNVKSSLGFAHGNAGDRIGLLNEFMSPQFLPFIGHANGQAKSNSVLFGSLLYLPKPNLPLAIEFLKPNGMVLNPILINLKIGYFLKMNFDLAYMKFNGGWDLLGMFQFRYTHFPRTVRRKN